MTGTVSAISNSNSLPKVIIKETANETNSNLSTIFNETTDVIENTALKELFCDYNDKLTERTNKKTIRFNNELFKDTKDENDNLTRRVHEYHKNSLCKQLEEKITTWFDSKGKQYMQETKTYSPDGQVVMQENSVYNNKTLYKLTDGELKPFTGEHKNGLFYVDGQPANGEYNGIVYQYGYKLDGYETDKNGNCIAYMDGVPFSEFAEKNVDNIKNIVSENNKKNKSFLGLPHTFTVKDGNTTKKITVTGDGKKAKGKVVTLKAANGTQKKVSEEEFNYNEKNGTMSYSIQVYGYDVLGNYTVLKSGKAQSN